MAQNEDDGIFHYPDFDEEKPFNLVLVDESLFESDGPGAELKTPFITQATDLGGEKQPLSVISERISDNELVVQCDLSQVIHGRFVKDGSPATLLVFQFCFVPLRNHRRFKEAEISITFSAGDVHAISPSSTWATFKSQAQQEVSHGISPALEGSFGPGKATLGYTWQFKENREVVGYARVVGLTQTLGQKGAAKKRKNTIVWGLYENEHSKPPSGIPSFMQAAALVKRLNDDEFAAEITISGKVDSSKWVNDKLERVTRNMTNSQKPEAVVFDPTKSRGAVDDVENLRDVDLEGYRQLVTIRTWTEGKERPGEGDDVEKTGESPQAKTAGERSNHSETAKTPAKGHHLMADAVVPAADVHVTATTSVAPNTSARTPPATSTAPQEPIIPLGGDKKAQRLHNLQIQLSTVREEKRLVQEERRLLREIMQLMD